MTVQCTRNETTQKKQTDDSFRKVNNENSRILLEPSHTLSVLLRSFFLHTSQWGQQQIQGGQLILRFSIIS